MAVLTSELPPNRGMTSIRRETGVDASIIIVAPKYNAHTKGAVAFCGKNAILDSAQ